MKKTNTDLANKIFDVKQINKSILRQYGVIIAIWAIVVFALIVLFGVYTYEMNSIYNISVTVGGETKTIAAWREAIPEYELVKQQAIYKAMFNSVFGDSKTILDVGNRIPVIWFSCMLFIPNFSAVSNWQTAWDSKLLLVTTAQIYILISDLLAFIGLIFYITLVAQYSVKLKKSHQLGCSEKYPLYKTDYGLYTSTTYVNFIIAISIFFSFYALSATVIMLVYMLVIKAIYKKIQAINESKNISDNIFKTSDLSYFKTLFIVMAVMIGYNIVNSIITSELHVDINSVLSGFFTTGGIAVIIVSLVKSLLSSSITEVRKKMKNIDAQIKSLRFFYSIRKGEAAFDYEFAKSLPPVIKKLIHTSKELNTTVLKDSFDKLFEYTDFINSYRFAKNESTNIRKRHFILYRMYNEIETFDEMEDIKINLIKLESARSK